MIYLPVVSVKLVRDRTIPMESIPAISHPLAVAPLLRDFLEDSDREQLVVLLLNVKNKVNGLHVVSIGDLSASIASPREIFKAAILSNAHSIIIAHNHPSGEVNPSCEDISLTQRLIECGKMIGIPILDHLIIGAEGRVMSLREKTHIAFE